MPVKESQISIRYHIVCSECFVSLKICAKCTKEKSMAEKQRGAERHKHMKNPIFLKYFLYFFDFNLYELLECSTQNRAILVLTLDIYLYVC